MISQRHIIEFLQKKIPDLQGIYLFGSHADGTAHANSDVDLAYLTRRPQQMPSLENFHLSTALGGMLNASVDLVDLQSAPTDFRFIIVSTSKRIFCSDKTFCDTFDMIAYSMYQRLELERRPIVEAIKKRGSVYG